MPPKRRLIPKENAERKRRRAEYMRSYRANMSDQQRSQIRENDSQTHRNARENMTDQQRSQIRGNNSQSRRNARENMSEQQISQIRESDSQRHRHAREKMSEQQISQIRESDSQRHRHARENMSEQQTSQIRENDSQRHRNAREHMSEQQISQIRENDSQRHRNARENMNEERRYQLRETDARRRRIIRGNLTDEQIFQDRNNASQRLRNLRLRCRNIRVAVEPIINENEVDSHNCGPLTLICEYCQAKHFKAEQPSDKKFTQCCQKGKVKLDPIPTSLFLQQLMTFQHHLSNNFHENIRSINSSLAFASMGANIAPPPGYGPYCFRINGQIYHRAGALHPDNDDQRKFAQLYILDPDESCAQRMALNDKCNPDLMAELSRYMADNNPFAEACKMLFEVEQECVREAELNGTEPSTVAMAILQDRNLDQRRYNAPRINEVAIVFQNADGEPPLERDLIIHCKSTDPNSRQTERISVLDPNLEPMVYPLLFPFGHQSWSIDLRLSYYPLAIHNIRRPISTNPRTRVTQMQYYGYRFSIRNEFNQFLSAGKLTQQYFVDAYVKTEANRLNFLRQNQNALRVEKYTGLMDHLQNQALEAGVLPGKSVILPSSFQGSPRNMQQNYQDAMAIVRNFGKPDFFITMTCNPKWPEIVDNLEVGQSSEFRPDLVARVFKLKLQALMDDIGKKHVLGTPVAKIHVIEFQKRGLPHAHILLILKTEDKPKDNEDIDNFICAEIPDIDVNPRLHAIVTKHMVHGPCGVQNMNSPCMVDGKCSKDFPKSFQEQTIQNCNGYPRYRRQCNGRTAVVRNKSIDNSWVVPYNPYFCLKYNCHINVESCASVKSVKYLFKYVYKGHDCANVVIQENALNHDEIKTFVDSRYVSAPEAAWRLFGFNMHEQSHTIVRLPVHLPNEQDVYFNEHNILQKMQQAAERDTKLTAWFKLNQEDETARTILYSDIPKHYVFDEKHRKWNQRQRGAEKTIGRMYSVSLGADPERFCLRLLLLHISAATSFEDLKTVNGVVHTTFKEAVMQCGLMNNDDTWENTLDEAILCSMPKQLRELFAYICVFAVPANAYDLYQKIKLHVREDYVRRFRHLEECNHCENLALLDIQNIFLLHGKNCINFNLPTPIHDAAFTQQEILDPAVEQLKAINLIAGLNIEQKAAFDEITNAMQNEDLPERCFFLEGLGGCGKTYVYKTLLSSVRGAEEIALPVASTGIAANLLEGGRTYHSQFKLPVPLLDTSTSSMRLNTLDAQLIRKSKVIIWDESTMAPSTALTAVDKLLQQIMKSSKPFGGKTLLIGGDFCQTLSVVPHGTRPAIVEASIKFNVKS